MSTFWQQKLKETLRSTVIGDSQIKKLLGTHFYDGELAGLKRKKYPIATFSVTLASGDYLDAFSGTVRIWVWSDKNSKEAQDIWNRIEELVHHQRLSGRGLEVVYVSNDNGLSSFNTEFQLNLWTGTINFRAFHIVTT